MQKVEPAVALHIKDQVEFTRIFVRQEVTALDSGSVQQHVNSAATLAQLVDDASYAVRIREVDAEVMRCTAGSAHGVDCALSSLRALQRCQLLLHQRRSGPLAARLYAREEIALQAVFVIDEALQVGAARVGFRDQIEQVERTAGSGCQIGGNGGDDTAGRARD